MTSIDRIFDDLLLEGKEKIRDAKRNIREYEFRIPPAEMKWQCFMYQMEYFVVEIDEKNIKPDSCMFAVVFGDHIHISIIDGGRDEPRYVSSVCHEVISKTKIIKRFFLSCDAPPESKSNFRQDETIPGQAIAVYKALKTH